MGLWHRGKTLSGETLGPDTGDDLELAYQTGIYTPGATWFHTRDAKKAFAPGATPQDRERAAAALYVTLLDPQTPHKEFMNWFYTAMTTGHTVTDQVTPHMGDPLRAAWYHLALPSMLEQIRARPGYSEARTTPPEPGYKALQELAVRAMDAGINRAHLARLTGKTRQTLYNWATPPQSL